jgi:hypothetical protein
MKLAVAYMVIGLFCCNVSAMPRIVPGCGILLEKPQLDNLNGEFASEIKRLVSSWDEFRASLEWVQTHPATARKIALTPDQNGNFNIPNLSLATLQDGRFAIVTRAIRKDEEPGYWAGIFQILQQKPISDHYFMLSAEDLDESHKIGQILTVLHIALASVPYVKGLQFSLVIRQNNSLDLQLGKGGLLNAEKFSDRETFDWELRDSTVHQNVNIMNIRNKALFEKVVELRNKGVKDPDVLRLLDLPEARAMPEKIGMWSLRSVDIVPSASDSSGAALRFENNDAIAIQFWYVRPD